MKVDNIKVKRNYKIPQMIVDAFSLLMVILLFQLTFQFKNEIDSTNALLVSSNVQVNYVQWWPTLVWPILGVILCGVSVLLTFMNRKVPKKYKITEATAQKYYDIIATAICCVRFIALFAVFEFMYIHQQLIMFQTNDLISVQIPCDIVVIMLILLFSKKRIQALQTVEEEKEEKKHQIIEQ